MVQDFYEETKEEGPEDGDDRFLPVALPGARRTGLRSEPEN